MICELGGVRIVTCVENNNVEVGPGAIGQRISRNTLDMTDISVGDRIRRFVEEAPGYHHRLLLVMGPFGFSNRVDTGQPPGRRSG